MPKYVTIQEGYYTYDINGENGKMFKPNHQYDFMGTTSINTVCCGDTMAFIIVTDISTYYIPVSKALSTDIKIQKHYQDFYKVWTEDFLQNMEHHSYREISNNCTNCNGLIPHGDYNNNKLTHGYKDPDIVPKEEDK